jgi:hypothetical protein
MKIVDLKTNKGGGIKFVYSCTPPTIRASIAYEKDVPIWAWLQIYSYSKHKQGAYGSASSKSFYSFSGSKDTPEILYELCEQIDSEYNNLTQCNLSDDPTMQTFCNGGNRCEKDDNGNSRVCVCKLCDMATAPNSDTSQSSLGTLATPSDEAEVIEESEEDKA